MILTCLGKYGPFAPKGGACSGYLVQREGRNILLDCGSGVLSRLQGYCAIEALDAVVLSHLHSDHMADMLILRYALGALAAHGGWERGPLPVYLPQAPSGEFETLAAEPLFEIHIIHPGLTANICGMDVLFTPMTHPVPSFAVTLAADGKRLVYSGDTTLNDKIVLAARGADAFLCDTGFLERDRGENAPHLSALQVGRIAAEADVQRLYLTHIYPRYEQGDLLREARLHFANTEVIRELYPIVIGE